MIITDGYTSIWSHTLLPLSSLTASILLLKFTCFHLAHRLSSHLLPWLWSFGEVKPPTKVAKPPKVMKPLFQPYYKDHIGRSKCNNSYAPWILPQCSIIWSVLSSRVNVQQKFKGTMSVIFCMWYCISTTPSAL